MGFFSKTRLKASDLMQQAVAYLVSKYDQAASVFTAASPFGQLLVVMANMAELVFTYITHTAEELNIETAQNAETIHGLSRLTGHDPWRGSSAYGAIRVKLNTNTNYIDGKYVIINNFTRFYISETGVSYFLNLNSDYVKLQVDNSEFITLNFMQGEIESQTFQSDGSPLQTFNPIIQSMTDHNNVAVTVNGEEWTKVDSLYDMPADDGFGSGNCFMAKSSVNVGLTIMFGNGDFGAIPPNGSTIVISYIKTNGSAGNTTFKDVTFNFTDSGIDESGAEINLNDILIIENYIPASLGSDYENPDFTKMIAPRTSKSFVLANPDNYVTYLQKYTQFTHIHAWVEKNDANIQDDGVVKLRLLPNIKKKLSPNQDYFDLPLSEFVLNTDEIKSVGRALYDSGQMLVNTDVEIVNPTLSRFVINVIIRYFDSANQISIRTDIRNIFSKYFLNINRTDIIPLSDLISLVEGIVGVDTCDIFFITEKNEQVFQDGYTYITTKTDNRNQEISVKNVIKRNIGDEDPRLGFDDFGNILIENDELCIPKGGWKDRYGNYFTPNPEIGKLGPLNIFFINSVDPSSYNQNLQARLNKLLKENN